MELKVAGKSHKGLKRKLNEDNFFIDHDAGIFVVADGMGGHKAGEVASKMVVDMMEDYWKRIKIKKPPSFLKPVEKDISNGAKHLVNSIVFANTMIHEAQKKNQYHGMGSTVSALYVEGEQIWSANVGDSPVYIFDRGFLTLISEVHSVEAEQRSMGLFDSLSTNTSIKNILTRVLGPQDNVDVYITSIKPEKGDILLMCSDGLTNYLSEKSIKTVLGDCTVSLERKVDILIDEANLGGGGDNITVILLEVIEEESRLQKLKRRFISKA